MPRIQAATVAEHRAQRIRDILDATRSILEETGEPPSMGEVGKRSGLARSSVYQYFPSVEKLLIAVAADVFPDWMNRILKRVAEAPTPGERVWAYIEENMAIFSSREMAVAQVLARIIEPQDLHAPMREFHLQLQIPLRQALIDLNEPEPEAMSELIDSLIVKAAHDVDADPQADPDAVNDTTLGRLRRLVGPYLGLAPETKYLMTFRSGRRNAAGIEPAAFCS